jgi:hypothetical protein
MVLWPYINFNTPEQYMHEFDIAVVKQLSVDLTNEPGSLATMAEALTRVNVLIEGISVDSGKGVSRVHFVVDKPEEGSKVLVQLGENVTEKEILSIVPQVRSMGQIAKIARVLADEQINVDVIYLTSAEKGTHPTIYLSASNVSAHDVAARLSKLH